MSQSLEVQTSSQSRSINLDKRSRDKYIGRLIDDCIAFIDCFEFDDDDDDIKGYQSEMQKLLTEYKKKRVSMSLILSDWLYVGGIDNAENITKLKQENINYIINMDAGFITVQYPKSMNINILEIDADDEDNYDTHSILINVLNLLINVIIGGKILIHCYAGMNRSVTICCAYLLQSNHKIDKLKSKKKFIEYC